MGEVIGETLGNAVGVAVSPLPLVAVIMTLMGQGGPGKGVALVVGWLVGLAVVLVVFGVAGPLVSGDDPGLVVALLKVAVGGLMLVLAVQSWRNRPRGDEVPEQPAWMTRVRGASAGASLGFGAFLAAVNPKNLGLTATAGGTIGAADLTAEGAVVVGVVFTVVASSVMLLVVGAALLAPERSGPALEALRTWLVANNSTVMLVLLLLMGSNLLGAGLRGLA